jgi:hypothetical protein
MAIREDFRASIHVGTPTSRAVMNLGLAALAIGLAVWLVLLLGSCSGTQVQQEMRGADNLALTANRGEPVWIEAMRLDAAHAADAVCTNVADEACVRQRLDATHAVIDRWVHVRDQWEIARVAHDAFAGCLETASDGGVCPDPEARQAALGAAFLLFRCELRAVWHPEKDPLGTGPIQCPQGRATGHGGYQ